MTISRRELIQRLSQELIHDKDEWLSEIRILPGGMINGMIVSHAFEELESANRRAHVMQLLDAPESGLRLGFLSLYTPEEADALELEEGESEEDARDQPASTWLDLSAALAEAEQRPAQDEETVTPRVVTFYSYKGGVGRTTAITHVAYELARRGRKVVLVDLDLEAPSLHELFEISSLPPVGILEYLYRSRPGFPEEQIPSIADTFCEVRFQSDVRGRLFVVPAGQVDSSYIARVVNLRVDDILGKNGPWDRFLTGIRDQIEPDYVLIDSRTGINDWAAFCLLRAAHEVFVVFFPNRQNVDGLRPLLEGMRLLGLGERVRLVASMFPARKEGERRALECLTELGKMLPGQADGEGVEAEEEQSEIDDSRALRVPYLEAVALADQVPVGTAHAFYDQLVNQLDESHSEASLIRILEHQGERKNILESLPFDVVTAEAMDAERLKKLFHRTSDFDKLLDGPTCLVRGRKGTGKSVLYWLFLKHPDVARELAGSRLSDKEYKFLSGHGNASPKPGPDEFARWGRLVDTGETSWHAIWRALVLIQLVPALGRRSKPRNMDPDVWQYLKTPISKQGTRWSIEHTKAVDALCRMGIETKYAFDLIDDELVKQNCEVWLFFDDLDEDFKRDITLRDQALAGMFELIQIGDSQKHRAVRFKVLLREDIWDSLVFQNKSHFNGRYIELHWYRRDVLRLALKQAFGSPDFKDIVRRFRPVLDPETADEEMLYNALEPLWGIRMGRKKSKYVYRWIYERLSDSQGNFFPRAMQHLLMRAKERELEYLDAESAQPPRDRLIRPRALIEGLKEKASVERVGELIEEYSEIKEFLDTLRDLSTSPVKTRAIEERWRHCNEPYGIPTKEAIRWLQSIGLMSDATREKEQKIADLYLWGLGLSRSGN